MGKTVVDNKTFQGNIALRSLYDFEQDLYDFEKEYKILFTPEEQAEFSKLHIHLSAYRELINKEMRHWALKGFSKHYTEDEREPYRIADVTYLFIQGF